ncbi:MAG: alpha/beta hydrolase [Longimicrobiales bacterium]
MSDLPDVKRVALGQYVASYREAGHGNAVVMVPGLGLSSRFYKHSYATFARAGFRFIVPDLPGTGETPGPRGGIDADIVTAFMIEFVEALGLARSLFVGHSLGTQSVLLLAMRAPARVAGIVLVGPTGGGSDGKLLRQARGIAAETIRVHPGVIGAVAREYMHVSPLRYLGTWLKHRDGVSETRLSEIDCPALLLLGVRDAVIDRAYMALLKAQLRDVRVVELPGGTHALPRGQHADFAAAVIEFAGNVRF